jgi:hypothetical protein
MKKELIEINIHIAFLKMFIRNLKKNIVYTGHDFNGNLRDPNGFKELTPDEIKNKKQLWIKNNTDSINEHLKIKAENDREKREAP